MRVSKRMAIALITVVFLAGFTLGHLSLKPSHAQAFPGPRAFRIAQLGPLIDQMQKNIDELQQNLKALREVKDALGASERGGGKVEQLPPLKPPK